MQRRSFVMASLLAAANAAAAQAPKEGPKKDPAAPPRRRSSVAIPGLVTPATEKAVQRGLEYLARNQAAAGSFGSGQYSENISVTSLSAIAMMAGGSMPGDGPFGDNVDRALDFVMKNTSPAGFVVVQRSTSHGPMYDHGFGTLFLAEAYGMTRRPEIREKVKKAIQLIINTQNHEGGWRYQPRREPQADISVTICQMMALRAARNAGIYVPRNTVDKCVDYVKKSQNPDGGFSYMLTRGPSAFPRSAAGVVTLYNAGVYNGRELEKGLEYINDNLPGKQDAQFRREYHYFYGHYYAVQAMYQAGDQHWAKWYPAIRDELVSRARSDGSWYDNICSEYGTAMACIILQIPNNLLPIFQH